VILLDTSGVIAALDADEPGHQAAARALESVQSPWFLSPFVLAELDYLVARRGGVAAEVALLSEVAAGGYQLAGFDSDDLVRAANVIERYRDLRLGLADASIVVLADRYGVRDVLTLDERHFRAIAGPKGKAFRLLPADA
jgi:uncharacterized protein